MHCINFDNNNEIFEKSDLYHKKSLVHCTKITFDLNTHAETPQVENYNKNIYK